jgi:hypothetical protein
MFARIPPVHGFGGNSVVSFPPPGGAFMLSPTYFWKHRKLSCFTPRPLRSSCLVRRFGFPTSIRKPLKDSLAALESSQGIRLTYRLECGDCGLTIIRRNIIDSHTATGIFEELVTDLRNALVGAIPCTEEHNSGPVVREVLFKLTAGASCRRWNIKLSVIHCDIKGVLGYVSYWLQH